VASSRPADASRVAGKAHVSGLLRSSYGGCASNVSPALAEAASTDELDGVHPLLAPGAHSPNPLRHRLGSGGAEATAPFVAAEARACPRVGASAVILPVPQPTSSTRLLATSAAIAAVSIPSSSRRCIR
jgi:hypothetical protein